MAKRTAIGTIIKLDGESTFRASIQNCKNSISAMKSEIQTITKQYEGNANSLEALGKIQEQYSEIQKRAKEQEEKMLTVYEKSAKKQDDVKESMQKMKDAYAEAQKKLQQMQDSGTATAESLEKQEETADEAYKAYLQYEAAVEKAESRTAYFQKALADAKTEELEAGEAVKKYAAYIEEANNSVDGTASSIDAYGREMKTAGVAAEAGGAGVSVFTGALGANIVTAGLERAIDVLKQGVEYAVQVGSEFEASQSKVKAISGATADEMSQIEEMSKKLGRTTKFSASEVSAGFSEMSLMGWSVQQQLAAMPGTVNLAIAAEMSLSEASQTVAKYLNAFGLGADYATEMADILTTAQSKSGAYAEDFSEAWKNCAANMNAAGQSIQTTTAVLEALANQGKVSSEAGVTLKAVMRDITSKMQDGAIVIGDTTVQVQDANGNFRDLIDILADVETATDGMGTAARAAALSAVFTDDSITGVNMALQEGVDNIRGYKSQLEDCDGAASDMADTMNDNLSGSMKNLGSAAEGLGNAAYNYIGGPLKSVVDGVTDAINGITDAIEPQVTEVTQFVDVVSEASDKIKKTMSDADSSYASGVSDASTIQSYIEVMEKARSQTSLTEFETFQLNNAIKSLSGNVPELNDYIDNTGKLLGLSEGGFNKLKELITTDYKRTLAQAVVDQRNAYAQALADAETAKKQAEEAISKSGDEFISTGKDVNLNAADIISATIFRDPVSLMEKMKTLGDSYGTVDTAKDSFKDASEAIGQAKTKLAEYDAQYAEYCEGLGISVDKNGEWVASLGDTADAAEKAADATDSAAKSIDGSADTIGDAAQEVTDTVRDAVSTYTAKMQEMGNADPADAIRDQLATAAAQVQEFQSTIQGNLQNFSLFGDRSSLVEAYTSTNRDEMKLNMSWALSSMETYTKELDELQKRGISSDFIEYLTSQGQAGLNYVHSLALASDTELKQFQDSFNQYQSYISGANDSVQKLLTDYAQGISGGIADGYNSWYEFGIETTAGLFDAIEEATEAIKNGSISGDIQTALQVVLQNKADQIAAEKTSAKRAAADNAAIANTGTKTRDITTRNGSSGVNTKQDITVSVVSPVYLDGEKISESQSKKTRAKNRIRGKS